MQPALDLSDAFVNIAEAVTPSVVRIETVRRLARERDGPPGQGQPPVSSGSGFIISADGHVMTQPPRHRQRRTDHGRPPGRAGLRSPVGGTDPTTDIAVIRIQGDDFPAVSWDPPPTSRSVNGVLAIGNPGFSRTAPDRLDYTVTAGIVSAVGRSLNLIDETLFRNPALRDRAGYAIENYIQTDAVINSGNSGGPM